MGIIRGILSIVFAFYGMDRMLKFSLKNVCDGQLFELVCVSIGNRNRKLSTFDILLERGAPLNKIDNEYFSPLAYAVSYRDYELVKYFLEHGADPNFKFYKNQTALHGACVFPDAAEIVKLLIEHGSAVNIKNDNGDTPLMFAVFKNNYEIAKLLLDNGASSDDAFQYIEHMHNANELDKKKMRDLLLSY